MTSSITTTTTGLEVPPLELSFDTPNRERFMRSDFRTNRNTYAILGRGSYGVVIKASYRNRPVAVKILEKPAHRQRYDSLLNEANALNLRHDNIVTVLKIVAGSRYGLVLMERFDGHSLQRILSHQRKHPIAVQHKLLMLCDIINGLYFCHRHKILHLDVKPQNVIVTLHAGGTPAVEEPGSVACLRLRNYLCKLCDFGSSMRLTPWQRSETLVNRGTIRYMAPELLRGQQRTSDGISDRADIYSFGVTVWQLDEERFPYDEITCNEVIVYNVVKKGLRPDSAGAGVGPPFCPRVPNLPVLRDIGCLHGSLRASIGFSGGGTWPLRFESDAINDVLKRQGIAVEYQRACGKGVKKPPVGVCWPEGQSGELTAGLLGVLFSDRFVLSDREHFQLKQTLRSLYRKCWVSEPMDRPDAATVRDTIHQALQDIMQYKCVN
ncbi:mitogen-activated protein kinase kinase kinase 7 [Anopheles nili]|uniref:mitogen-activated protein kinase kinase kinase 7 n=1 Tax=Anopheles nili TaxID=185578 RepID=UPI00237C4D2E|nr:mitogen-activated protein kinase kinase kinase 7 [Anopheles nili]